MEAQENNIPPMGTLKPHTCNRCGKSLLVYAYDLKTGEYIYLCKECSVAVLGNLIERISLKNIKKYI